MNTRTRSKKAPNGALRAFLDALPAKGAACIFWPFTRNGYGYGRLLIPGRGLRLAHRIVCERVNGPAPTPHHHAAHSCGKGHLGCVAPWHLAWKTPAENNADRLVHGTHGRGERNHAAKLSETQVRKIQTLAGTASLANIGKRFGVSQTTIGMILSGKRWAHLPKLDGVAS